MTSFCPLSAGVGRTGTFLAVDALLDNGRKTGQVNVFDYVRKMRECRMNMVQTEVGQTMRAVLACGHCERVRIKYCLCNMPVMLNNFFFWQTQYIFVHEVLFEAFRYKSHAILYREFAKEFKKLYGGDQPTNENPLRMEYNVIIFSCIITCNINVTLIKHVNIRLYSNLSVWLIISTLITHF